MNTDWLFKVFFLGFSTFSAQPCFRVLDRAGFKGGQTGQSPRASTTRGASTKTVKNYYLKEK